MQILHVIMNQQHLEAERLPGKTVVVLDVIFATTTIAMALHHGAREVHTVGEIDEARQHAHSAAILAGEKDAIVPEGFFSFSPTLLSKQPLEAQRLVLVTTNGTVALANSRPAQHIYTCALVNTAAIATHLLANHDDGTLLLVCSASRHRFNIEDFVGAGVLVDRLVSAAPNRFALSDASLAARALAQSGNLRTMLYESRVGRMMCEMNLRDDLELAATTDCYDVVPKLVGDSIVDVGRNGTTREPAQTRARQPIGAS